MARYDISRLRKEIGMSQSELARKLKMTQSFLSAIENGKSPLPIDKEERLREIFPDLDISVYATDKNGAENEKRLNDLTDSDLFNQLLNRFHRQAHSTEDDHHHNDNHEKIEVLEKRIQDLFSRNDSLMERNDRLSMLNDSLLLQNNDLRKEIDRLRNEIFRLKTVNC